MIGFYFRKVISAGPLCTPQRPTGSVIKVTHPKAVLVLRSLHMSQASLFLATCVPLKGKLVSKKQLILFCSK